VTSSVEYTGRLRSLGLSPVAMASWGKVEEQVFVSNWSALWKRFVNPEIWSFDYDIPRDQDVMGLPPAPTQIDTMMINSWLLNDQTTQTPLEFTLKVWAAYAGDMLGRRPLAGIEAYLRRMSTTIPTGRAALEKLAKTMTLNGQPLIHRSQVDATGALPEIEISEDEEFEELEEDLELEAPEPGAKVSVRRALSRLVNLGLLRGWDGGRVSFPNPVFQGYLTGSNLNHASEVEQIYTQPDWVGRSLALKYLAAFGEVSPLAVQIMENSEDPLQQGLLTLGTWLSNSNKSDNWRALTMRRLAKLIQNDVYSSGLRFRALASMATSGDKDVAMLFRHLMNSDSSQVRQLGTLGAGYLLDVEAVDELAVKLYDPTPNVRRAACLALVNIGTDKALEQTASALLHGEEELRRAAAEAFANHPTEGHPILRDGATLDDLLVRRAVVFGLLRIREDWAIQLLQELQMGDEQWVVRNAASQALEDLDNINSSVPVPQPPIHELPWLIAYAGDKGKGVTAGKPAQEMLRQALKDGKEEERQAAMEQIYREPDTGMIIDLMHILYDNQPDLREAAFNTLWHLNLDGIDFPPPAQFGIGGKAAWK
jgi:HEAT repeat protein